MPIPIAVRNYAQAPDVALATLYNYWQTVQTFQEEVECAQWWIQIDAYLDEQRESAQLQALQQQIAALQQEMAWMKTQAALAKNANSALIQPVGPGTPNAAPPVAGQVPAVNQEPAQNE